MTTGAVERSIMRLERLRSSTVLSGWWDDVEQVIQAYREAERELREAERELRAARIALRTGLTMGPPDVGPAGREKGPKWPEPP